MREEEETKVLKGRKTKKQKKNNKKKKRMSIPTEGQGIEVSQNLKSWIIANMVRFSDLSEMHFDAQS